MSGAARTRWIATIVGVAAVAFVSGVWIVGTSERTPPPEAAAAVTIGNPPAADGPIELTPEMEPYDYRPAPRHEATPVDGFYMRVFTIEEMGGPELGVPTHCLRCVPYSVDAGVQTLLLHEGRFFLEHQINRFRALGHYVVRGDRIVFFNDVNCSRTRGWYRWGIDDRALTMRVLDDPCPYVDERSHDLTLAPWTKIDVCHSGIEEWYPALVGC
ncbi:MAG: hypothetical protein ACRDGK_05625 [Actinomycetota bacterium]